MVGLYVTGIIIFLFAIYYFMDLIPMKGIISRAFKDLKIVLGAMLKLIFNESMLLAVILFSVYVMIARDIDITLEEFRELIKFSITVTIPMITAFISFIVWFVNKKDNDRNDVEKNMVDVAHRLLSGVIVLMLFNIIFFAYTINTKNEILSGDFHCFSMIIVLVLFFEMFTFFEFLSDFINLVRIK